MEASEKLQQLEWLLDEVDGNLKEATDALEQFLVDSADEAQMELCQQRIHQVGGSLALVDVAGPVLLTTEMELVAGDLRQGKMADSLADSCQVLAQAMLQLPSYLRQLVATRKDHPESLLLILNDLRAVRNEPLASSELFFSPYLDDVLTASGQKKVVEPEVFTSLLEKLRQMYQHALLGLFREEKFVESIGYLSKAFSRLRQLSAGTANQAVWRAALAIMEGLEAGSIKLSPSLKLVLRALDEQFELLLMSGAPALQQPAPQVLLKNMLFYIALGRLEQPESKSLRDECQLDKSLSEDLWAENNEAIISFNDQLTTQALVTSFNTEIAQIKDYLERYTMEGGDPAQLDKSQVAAQRLAGSLSLVGLAGLQQQALVIAERLDGLLLGSVEDEHQVLTSIADTLIAIETGLYHWQVQNGSVNDEPGRSSMVVDSANESLLLEARRALEDVKAAVVDYIASQWKAEKLAEVPQLLAETRGAFQLLNQEVVANLLAGCENYIASDLLKITPGESPAWDKLDALAEVLTSIEYYIDFLDKREPDSAEQILIAAQEKMTALGHNPADTDSTAEPVEDLAADQVDTDSDDVAVDFTAEDASSEETSDVDDEILEIFVEEAEEVAQELLRLYPQWAASPADKQLLGDIRRNFHTLKGSGRMVGAEIIGQLAWAVEDMLNKVIDKRVDNSPEIMALVDLCIEQVIPLTDAFKHLRKPANLAYIEALGQSAESISRGDSVALPVSKAQENSQQPDPVEEKNTLHTIFASEAETHLSTVESFVAEQKHEAPVYSFPPGAIQRALHTLKGSAKMADLTAIADIVSPLEHFVKELFHHQIDVDADIVQLMEDATVYVRDAVEQLLAGDDIVIPQAEQFLKRLEELKSNSLAELYDLAKPAKGKQVDPALLNTLMSEGMSRVLDAEQLLADWQQQGDSAPLAGIIDELMMLSEAAAKANIEPLRQVSELLGNAYMHIRSADLKPSEGLVADLQAGHEQLLDMADTVAASLDVEVLDEEIANALAAITALQRETLPESIESAEPVSSPEPTPPLELVFERRPVVEVEVLSGEDIDRDILETFLTEADELNQEFSQALHAWQQDFSNTSPVESIKRILHTLKGGARMAGLSQIGDLSHELESDVLQLEPQISLLDPSVFEYLLEHEENLNNAIDHARQFLEVEETEEIIEAPQPEVDPEPELSEPDNSSAAETVEPDGPVVDRVEMPAIERSRAESQEMVRVSASMIDKLVNLAGEASISRGRIEQQISEFYFSLDEMEATIRRLQGQVRLLGIETEAQVVFRREQIEASASIEGFDPLEMDRYSQLQQLSRSLLESSSDLLDLRNTLVNTARDSETQLLEQSRIQTDLQESLMRAQMVPFSHIVPRLRRIVRQLSQELGKRVKLNFVNQEGEMDRSVLEKMVAPLEHMLRNAIDHGVEAPEKRKTAGKPQTGNITIGVERRGGEVLITLADDGQGLPIAAIRKKALDQGLMDNSSDVSDRDVAQFIFNAGFSTSKKVTQVSGRGVGMDVVYSQVRQLGGTVEIDSQSGEGAEFKIRLPFTVSVNRALMVGISEDLYALPLNSIDGVVNISPKELENYYRSPEVKLEYGGRAYDVLYLGSLLSEELVPKIDSAKNYHSLMLVHSETGAFAVHVDSLLASQEVVVKSLGAQFSKVSGLSGATVLGDGRVVVILELLELLRTQSARRAHPVEVITDDSEAITEDGSVQSILVVDDSVTVRKVTGRFLEREGFRVLTATDGVEALNVLQDHTPDLMLLDIEMPRMDGFEVAHRVKTTSRWKEIPIIMITSRTGQKHRDRAADLGVERYVGKPYQEDVLLENINALIGIDVT